MWHMQPQLNRGLFPKYHSPVLIPLATLKPPIINLEIYSRLHFSPQPISDFTITQMLIQLVIHIGRQTSFTRWIHHFYTLNPHWTNISQKSAYIPTNQKQKEFFWNLGSRMLVLKLSLNMLESLSTFLTVLCKQAEQVYRNLIQAFGTWPNRKNVPRLKRAKQVSSSVVMHYGRQLSLIALQKQESWSLP